MSDNQVPEFEFGRNAARTREILEDRAMAGFLHDNGALFAAFAQAAALYGLIDAVQTLTESLQPKREQPD